MFFLCFKIFLARICDVSLGTIKTMQIIKGNRKLSCLIAFFELIIWFYAAREALNTEINPLLVAVSYASGYTFGTYLGIIMNDLINNHKYEITVLSNKINLYELKKENFFCYQVNKDMIKIISNKKQIKRVIKQINEFDNKCFISIVETKIIK